jgi:hypothetical protein
MPSSISSTAVALESLDGFRYPIIDKPLTALDGFRYFIESRESE